MLTEQSATHEKSRRTISIENNRKTMARDQYQYNWTTSKIKKQEYNCGYSGLIYQNNQAQSNNNNSFI